MRARFRLVLPGPRRKFQGIVPYVARARFARTWTRPRCCTHLEGREILLDVAPQETEGPQIFLGAFDMKIKLPAKNSERDSCRQLNDTRIGGAQDLPKSAAGNARIRVVELGFIEEVKELRTE